MDVDNFEKAVAYFSKSITLFPKNKDVHLLRNIAAFKLFLSKFEHVSIDDPAKRQGV